MAAIYGERNKKVQGLITDFETSDGKEVVVNFTETKNGDTPQKVSYQKLLFPNYKTREIAEEIRKNVIAIHAKAAAQTT